MIFSRLFATLAVAFLSAALPAAGVELSGIVSEVHDNFFKNLKRPDSPNNWLVAPAGFVIKPDTVAPTFEASVSVLHETFKSVVLQSKGQVTGKPNLRRVA